MKKHLSFLITLIVLTSIKQLNAQQTDINVNNDPGQCGAVVNYTAPETSIHDAVPPHTINDFNTIGYRNNSMYYISTSQIAASTSYSVAHAINAYVATVPNADVNQFLTDYLNNNNVSSAIIGYNDVISEGNFMWDSGSTSTYTHWASGEPNNVNNEDFTELLSNGYWNDVPGYLNYDFIIEKPGKPFELLMGPASGSLFDIGLTQVIFKGIDNTGNTVFYPINVTVTDNEPPHWSNYSDISVNVEPGSCGAQVNYTPPVATDNCDTGTKYTALSEYTLNDLNDWTITSNGGDGWIVNSDNRFQTSYNWDKKKRIIDLTSLNYDTEVLDAAPMIYVSEKYRGGGIDKADKYWFKVSLLDANDNVIDSYDSGILTTIDGVQIISHTFSNYGPGVRKIMIEDGGRDAESWAGHYGSLMFGTKIRIFNKILVKQISGLASGDVYPIGTTTNVFQAKDLAGNTSTIGFDITVSDNEAPQMNCPNDININVDSGICGAQVNYTLPNTTDNCSSNEYYTALSEHALNDLNDWTLTSNPGGNSWTVNAENQFVTSHGSSEKERTIDLLSLNYDPEVLDTSPDIIVSEKCLGTGPDYADTYRLTVILKDANNNILDIFHSGNITTSNTVQTISHTFSGYPAGVRKIVIKDYGTDVENWQGFYGAKMFGTQIKIEDKVLLKQSAGLASGDVFPVGTTTNEYQAKDLAGNVSNCTFDVTVTDNELPVINCPGNQTIDLQVNQTTYTLPDYISNGDVTASDNCSIANITQSPAAGTDLTSGTYQINFEAADPSGNTQTCSFELVINDANGIHENYQTNNIKLYPNPAKHTINLEVTEHISIYKIEIFDITGRKIYSDIFTNNFKNKSINISKLATGKYFMHLQTDSGLYIKQFLVNK